MPLLAAISQQRWKNLRGGGVISLTMEDTLGKAVWTSLRVGVRQLQGSLSNPSTVKPKSWEAATDVLKDLEPLFLRKSFVVISLHLDQQALVATSHHCFTFRPDGSVYVPHFCRTLGPEACSLGTPLDIRFEERVAKCVASKPTAWSPTESADDVACGAGKVEEWQFWLVHSDFPDQSERDSGVIDAKRYAHQLAVLKKHTKGSAGLATETLPLFMCADDAMLFHYATTGRTSGALVGFKVKTPTKIAKEWRLFGMNSSPLTPWAAASGIPYTACWEKATFEVSFPLLEESQVLKRMEEEDIYTGTTDMPPGPKRPRH
ncbi:unnamed protein product [Cladocopium goreaui]|uniref:Uncharacterized protein n=1 Tax=Cladocopium goreaui TaxID=2562237 RepID=A0A9P1DI17_9DINO|nr:unnamed protein product [Cladocopium goreaui]